MDHLATSQPFPHGIFQDFAFKTLSSPKTKSTMMSYSQTQAVSVKQEKGGETATRLPVPPLQSKCYDTEPKLGSFSPPLDISPKLPSWKLSSDIPGKDIVFQHPQISKPPQVKSEHRLSSSDTSIPSISSLQSEAQLYFTQVNNNRYIHHNSHSLLSSSFGSLPLSRDHMHEPLPNIWGKVPPSKQGRIPSPDTSRPHAELLLHLRRPQSLPLPLSPPIPPPPPPPPASLVPRTVPPTTRVPIVLPPSAPRPQFVSGDGTNSNSSVIPIPHQRPRRANDYTGEFKREFCALLSKHADARAQWEQFWRKRECTGRRPCIKSYLAFCDIYAEFGKLRRAHKYRVLGTRTNCECGMPANASTTQSPTTTRFSPY